MKTKKVVLMGFGFVLILVGGIFVFLFTFAGVMVLNNNFQENISFTVNEIARIFNKAGYSISDIEQINETNSGAFMSDANGIFLEIFIESRYYDVFIIDMSSSQQAKDFSKYYSNIDKEIGLRDNFGYSFAFGNVVVIVCPPQKISVEGKEYVDYHDYSYRSLGRKLRWILYKESIFE